MTRMVGSHGGALEVTVMATTEIIIVFFGVDNISARAFSIPSELLCHFL